ncbi:hypothetical protein ACWCWD_25230 [Streptomyces sp. NPDC001493]
MSWTTDDNIVRLPSTRLQPIAADDALADAATGKLLGGTLNVSGRGGFPLGELGRLTLRAPAR